MKILYIPADNISANFSRSFHIAKNLSEHCDLYRVRWHDNRSAFWEGKKPTLLNSLNSFLKSIFQTTSITPSNEFGFDVHTSVFISAFVGRLLGKYNAFKFMHKYNLKSLRKITKQIQPDIIFHADGFYFFPALNEGVKEYSDLQDDINWSNFPNQHLNKIYQYYTTNFNSTIENFIVSESAQLSIKKHLKTEFTPLSNGASFKEIASISASELIKFKEKFNIPKEHKIISYIGGEHKFDKYFAIKLSNAITSTIDNTTLVLAGNLPTHKADNVIYTGILANAEANVLYRISDVGITLKNTKNNDFIYNSVPLKFVQYAAAQKPIVSFPIKWSCENKFPNIKHIESEDTEEWVIAINSYLKSFKWEDNYTKIWEEYSWENIIKNLYERITK